MHRYDVGVLESSKVTTAGRPANEVMKTIGWKCLAERRKKSKIILMYKIDNNLVDIPKTRFKPFSPHGRRSNMILHLPYCKSDTFRFSLCHTVNQTHFGSHYAIL